MSEDEEWQEEEEILDNVTACPTCNEETGHEILREKKVGNGSDFMLRCEQCGKIHTVEFRPPPPTNVPFILTEGPHSERIVLIVDADEIFVVGDVFEEDEKLWKIHQIETTTGQYMSEVMATDIKIITAIRTDMVRVKLTLTRGGESSSNVMIVSQESSFTASHLVDFEGETWRIRAIHTGTGRTLRGTVKAPEIKRMYLHEPPKPEHFLPRTPRERRQAWKEGRLGFNPNPIRPKDEVKKGVHPQSSKGRTSKKKRT